MHKEDFSLAKWHDNAMHPQGQPTASTIDWIFMIDLLNFSFWLEDGTSVPIEYKGERYTGYFTLCACINRALEQGIPVTTPSYVATAPEETLANVFDLGGSAVFPMIPERVASLKQAAAALVAHFDGSFVNVVAQANGSAIALINLVLKHFPTFRDIAQSYHGRPIHVLKRAQILVADIWACFEGQSHGHFHDIDKITMFADYRVPQALVVFGLIEYTPELLQRLASHDLIESGDADEVEIRACSIWSVELVRRAILRKLQGSRLLNTTPVNAIVIDFYLYGIELILIVLFLICKCSWDFTKAKPGEIKSIPFHRTRSQFY